MKKSNTSVPDDALTDEQLTAYLDGALAEDDRTRVENALAADPQAQQRLAQLELPDGLFAQAFDLDAMGAPAMPAALRTKVDAAAAPQVANTNKAPRYFWPASLAASFALGMLLMTALRPAGQGPEQMSWVDTVASYQALYVTETLSGQRQAPEITQSVLARAESLMGVDLQAALEIDGLDFKRVQMLSLDGEPLIQMAYLDAQGQPYAFCLTMRGTQDAGQMMRMSFDLATSSWVEDGVGFVLVGGQDETTTNDIAAQFRRAI